MLTKFHRNHKKELHCAEWMALIMVLMVGYVVVILMVISVGIGDLHFNIDIILIASVNGR